MTGAFRAIGAFCAFGKLPSHPDFVRIGANSELFARFDQWLTDSVEWAHAKNGSRFAEAFRAGSMRAFMYRGDGTGTERALIVGALAPSQDEAGRLFPICLGAPVVLAEEFATRPHLLPFACEDIWQAAGETLAELVSNPEVDLAARLVGLTGQSAVPFSDVETAYGAWGRALPISELESLVAGSAGGSLRGALRLMAEAVQPQRERSVPGRQSTLSLRFPLGAAGGAAVCFWLDALWRLLGESARVPSVFWSHAGESGDLTVHPGSAPVSTVSELWLPSTRYDEFCDLTQPLTGEASEALARLPARVEQALNDRSSSVAGLLAALGAPH